MSACPLVVLACESLHVCTVCIWRCEHARFCVEVFYALYINFHSFIHSFIFFLNLQYHRNLLWLHTLLYKISILILPLLLKLASRRTCSITISTLFFTVVPIFPSDARACVYVCVVNVIVKRPVLPPCDVDGRSRNCIGREHLL